MSDRAHHRSPEGPVSRRRFLAGVGAVAGVAVAGRVLDVWGPAGATSALAATAGPAGGALPDRTLVVVELGGGNDGLNTVVPHADPLYARLRPTLGVKDPIDLDGRIGFDPKLARLAERYRAGQVAIVEGVGYPNPDLSHFASMAVWWSGDPEQRAGTGWLGRYLDAAVGFDDPLAGLVIGTGPSPALLGARSFSTTIADTTGLQPNLPAWIDRPGDLVDVWKRFAPAKVSTKTLTGQVERAIRLTDDARTRLGRDLGDAAPAAPAPGSTSVVADLALAAELVASADPPRVVYVSTFGDFDTHQGEAQRHPVLMEQLDASIDTFFSRLETANAGERAVVMTTSEFGRRPAENGSGTDHGTASTHLVVGPKVSGGRYGDPPSLSALDANGNPAMTVDFRTYFSTVLQGWLGVDPEPLVGTGFAPLPLFR